MPSLVGFEKQEWAEQIDHSGRVLVEQWVIIGSMNYVVVSTLFGILASCGGKTEAIDSAGVVFCDEIPDVTYDSFTEGFFLENCQGCHGSMAQDRKGAPESVTFDTEAEIWSWATEIEEAALSANPTMPPSYSIHEDDLVRLQWWLDCGLWEM